MPDFALETALVGLARQHAPSLVGASWRRPGDYLKPLPELATQLAAHNLLVMRGELPPSLAADYPRYVQGWVESYVRLYQTLTGALFPSFAQVNAFYANSDLPPIVVVSGTATPVIVALARFVVPYVAARQGARSVSDFEINGLLDMLLDELEAGDLPREQYVRLRDDCALLLKTLIAQPVRQGVLAQPHRALLDAFDLGDRAEPPQDSRPLTLPGETIGSLGPPPAAPPPDKLPEEPGPPPEPGPFASPTPIFFDRQPRGNRPPPVPPLPEDIP